MPRKLPTDRPEKVETPEERGQMLRYLISKTKKTTTNFYREAGLPRSTFNALLSGQNDLAKAEERTASAILYALGLEDHVVADALNLPPEARANWRTMRPAPFGDDRDTGRDTRQLRLTRPLMGEVVLPPDSVITIDHANQTHGIQVVRLPSGEIYSMRGGAAAQAAGEVMGQLLSTDFAAVLFAPGQ